MPNFLCVFCVIFQVCCDDSKISYKHMLRITNFSGIPPHISTPKSRKEVAAVFVLMDELFWRGRTCDPGVKKWCSQGLGCSLGHVTSVDAVPPRTLSQNLENERFDPHHLKDHVSLSFLSSEALIITLWNTLTLPKWQSNTFT